MVETLSTSYSCELNPAQRRAAEFGVTVDRIGGPIPGAPLAVIAGAGTGKTTTLAHRVANLILAGGDPQRVLLLTFSRRAAQEMTRRARQIVREGVASQSNRRSTVSLPWSGTFHATANRLLRMYATDIGLPAAFSILDRSDAADLMNICRSDLGVARGKRRFPTKHTCVDIYSRVVNAQQPLLDCLRVVHPWCVEWQKELADLFRAYVALKQESRCLDYDDLLLYWFHLMQDSALAQLVGDRFDFVLVDEYQDTNVLQAGILQSLKPNGAGVTIVGDDAQAIYGFRAATVENILGFPNLFSPAADVIKLTQNYRSAPAILAFANTLMAQSERRYDKDLVSDRAIGSKPKYVCVESEHDQVQYVVDTILRQREQGALLRDQAVLFRNAQHSDLLELELTRRNIPYVKYGGLKFLEAAHVKDFVAMLRWLNNPRDRSAAFRILLLLPGIGPGRAAKFWAYFKASDYRFAELKHFTMPASTRQRWQG